MPADAQVESPKKHPMRWRMLRLDWRYAIGELVIVTAGVLVALAIDEWNNDRLERRDEVLIIDGLIADLEFDRARIEQGLSFLPEKEASLKRVYDVLDRDGQDIVSPSRFLEDIIEGSRYGWVQFEARTSTFDELLGSGRFGLIRDSALRLQISEYYARTGEASNRIDERETVYPDASYQFAFRTEEFDLDPSLTESQIARLARRAAEALPMEAAIAEINFSRFVGSVLLEAEEWRMSLLEALQAYRQLID